MDVGQWPNRRQSTPWNIAKCCTPSYARLPLMSSLSDLNRIIHFFWVKLKQEKWFMKIRRRPSYEYGNSDTDQSYTENNYFEKNRIGIGLEKSVEIINHADNYQRHIWPVDHCHRSLPGSAHSDLRWTNQKCWCGSGGLGMTEDRDGVIMESINSYSKWTR